MSYRTYQFFREFGFIQRQLNRRGAFTVQASDPNVRKKKAAREEPPFLAGTVRSKDELARDLGNPLIRGSGRERSVGRRRRELHEGYLAKERRVSVRIRRTIIRMVEPVVGTQTKLERHTLGDCKILLYAQVASQESWTTKSVTADTTHKVRAGGKVRR